MSTNPAEQSEVVEGARCHDAECTGTLEIYRHPDCFCYISPPCGYCVPGYLRCDECGEVYECEE